MKHIIIIGGSSGIGLCLCQRLIENGNAVTCISTSECPVSGVASIVADVTDGEKFERIFSDIHAADALIYCAGISLASPVECVERADVKRLIDINLVGAIDCCRLALPLLRQSDSGRIILLGSTGGTTPIAYDSFYSASKAGLMMFCQTLAVELPKNVKCTTAIIGGTRTRFSFKRKIYDCNGTVYERDLKAAANSLINIEQTGYAADFVAKKIVGILNAASPPPIVSIGLTKKLMTAISKITPSRALVWLTKKIFKIDSSH